jgi:hypothetical protein
MAVRTTQLNVDYLAIPTNNVNISQLSMSYFKPSAVSTEVTQIVVSMLRDNPSSTSNVLLFKRNLHGGFDI